MEPLLEYIEEVQRNDPHGYVTVILPEFVPHRLWQHLLHNQHALLIKGALLFKPNVVVTSVPFTWAAPQNARRRRRRARRSGGRLISRAFTSPTPPATPHTLPTPRRR